MSPRNIGSQLLSENTPLILEGNSSLSIDSGFSVSVDDDKYDSTLHSSYPVDESYYQRNSKKHLFSKIMLVIMFSILLIYLGVLLPDHVQISVSEQLRISENHKTVLVHEKDTITIMEPNGPYKLVERQEGLNFFNFYTFYDGPDSEGSAGYNTYVSKEKAQELGIVGVMNDSATNEEYVFMKSSPTDRGPRSSIRLEGIRRFDRGLFILDLRHMPNGPGVWPAFWLTDETNWPYNGEIDIVEGINFQSVAKTALHTSEDCSMFAHVPSYAKNGSWEWSSEFISTIV